MTYNALWHRLVPRYAESEAKAIVRLLLDGAFGMSLTDVLSGKVTQLSPEEGAFLEEMMLRLEAGEPVQYVLGKEIFCGREYKVDGRVLIPRPETEELCRLIIADNSEERIGKSDNLAILDIGTGSGCIAITLALELAGTQVAAWDVSEGALAVARANAQRLHANVLFEQRDILKSSEFRVHSSELGVSSPEGGGQEGAEFRVQSEEWRVKREELWDVIVSNPPYICVQEKALMEPNVLEHEPHSALFVPNEDPLLFYRAIADYAVGTLKDGGRLYLEINPIYAEDLQELLTGRGFSSVEVCTDSFGRQRIIKAKYHE